MKKHVPSACLPIYTQEWWKARLKEAEAQGPEEHAKVASDFMAWRLSDKQLPSGAPRGI